MPQQSSNTSIKQVRTSPSGSPQRGGNSLHADISSRYQQLYMSSITNAHNKLFSSGNKFTSNAQKILNIRENIINTSAGRSDRVANAIK